MRIKTIIKVQGNPVKVYTNKENTHAYIFPPFGRYYGLNCDTGVLDFAAHFLLSINHSNVITFQSYVSSGEETQPMYQLPEAA